MRLARAVAAVLAGALMASACGSPHSTSAGVRSTHTSSASRTTTTTSAARTNPPSPPPTGTLLGILHARYATGASDTAEWVGRDGHVLSQLSYTPLPIPVVGNARFVFPPQGWVVAGGLYFIDGHGVVRRLEPSGAVTTVATFPITSSQQLVSFIVRPDGGRLGAIVVTLPIVKNPLPPNPVYDGFFVSGSRASLDVEWADAGGQTTTTLHKDLGTNEAVWNAPTLLEGWDHVGPIATVNSLIGTQGDFWGYPMSGRLIHIAEDGTHLDPIGGSDCSPAVDELFNGTVVCSTGAYPSASVRTPSGSVIWSVPEGPQSGCSAPRLSPEGNQLAPCAPGIAKRDGAGVVFTGIPSKNGILDVFAVGGWLNNDYVVMVDANGQDGLGLVDSTTGVYQPVLASGAYTFIGALLPQ